MYQPVYTRPKIPMLVAKTIFNGSIIEAAQPQVGGGYPALKLGDGLFETMRYEQGDIALLHMHLERLNSGMQLLGFAKEAIFFADVINSIRVLCQANELPSAAVRMSVYRSATGFDYAIEATPLPAYHTTGLTLGIYDLQTKAAGALSGLKSTSRQLYEQAARHARAQQWHDAIILNAQGRLCETTIANIFIMRGGRWHTPALSEGCVAGVYRRWLLECSPMPITEGEISLSDLAEADAVFTTNALRGIQTFSVVNGQPKKELNEFNKR